MIEHSTTTATPLEGKLTSLPRADVQWRSGHPRQNADAWPADPPASSSGRHQSEVAQRFLLEISAEFVSRDYETTLKRLAVRAIPFLADYCSFDVLGVDGTIERVGHAQARSLGQIRLDRGGESAPTLGSIDYPISKVLRTGQTEFVPEIDDAWMQETATSEQQLAVMRDHGFRSMISVPLLVPGLTLGVLTFYCAATSGRLYGMDDVWLAEDVAHRTALVVENARLYHELQDASRRKDEFLAMLGHELRNPLAPIRNSMAILRFKSDCDPELGAVTEVVERQVQQLTRLIDDLLDVSRVGHGKINLQMKTVDLRRVIALALEISRPLIDARKHTIEVLLPREPVEVTGDAGRLTQVISNLLNNSAKYSDDGGRIKLMLEVVGEQALVRVSDSGIGIEPAMLPKIFDLFAQVASPTGRIREGLGIGLSLVRNMIELHGGCVQATSAGLGRGAEFVIRLPLATQVPAIEPAEHANRARETENECARRILVVDDNRDSADSMAILLRMAGHDVTTAYDGSTALALARRNRPEVVICDIGMPGMGGVELARQLRHGLGLVNSLLIALSGYAREEDCQRSQVSGFNAHLVKPVRLDRLKALLASDDFLSTDAPRTGDNVMSSL